MQFTALFLCLVAVASAAPAELVARAATTCGNTNYSAAQVDDAAKTSCGYVQSGGTAGSSTYPHQYKNYEHFNFPVPGKYWEFPIKPSGKYNGGSPGPDRVIINDQCQLAGVITHTGASGNNFVGCEGNSTNSGDNKPKQGSDGNSGNNNKSGNDDKKSAAVAAKYNLLGAAGAGAVVLLYVL